MAKYSFSFSPKRSPEFRDFLKRALDKNPETRPSATQLLEVKAGLHFLSGLFVPSSVAWCKGTDEGLKFSSQWFESRPRLRLILSP